MQSKDTQEALTYFDKEPDVEALASAYADTTTELSAYIDLCRNSYDERRNYWPSKSRDLRKHGADAFPWDGASDSEAHVIDERINRLTSLCMSALSKANIRAFPVESSDIARSKVVSGFMKWMVSSGYIARFKQEMEFGANMLFERGIFISYVGWQREDRRFLQNVSLESIAQIAPEVAQAILNGTEDKALVQMVMKSFKGVTEKRAKKAISDLRKTGFADVPIIRRQVDAPLVKTLTPDGDFFFPSWTTDPQQAPYCFWRTYMTAQELENKVLTEGWDAGWVEKVIKSYRGVNVHSVEREYDGRRSLSLTDNVYQANDLVEVICAYQRLIDKEDGAEGIYRTVFHRSFTGDTETRGYALFELMNGYEDYPVVVTRLSEDAKRLYDTHTIPDKLRGIQNQIKVERDSRIDRNSMATMPPIMHPVGNAPSDWGPGRYIPYRRAGEFQFGPTPAYNPGSVEMEQTMQQQADRLVGLDKDHPISQQVLQFLVDKYLNHVAEVLRMSFRCFQRFGPDKVLYQVTGVADPQQLDRGNPDENYDLSTDPENLQNKVTQFASLLQFDKNGRINIDSFLDVVASSIDPIMAAAILQPAEQAQQQMVKHVSDDLTKISSSIEVPARPNGAQIALQLIQQYVSQPDVQQRMQGDEAFSARIQKYAEQYQFQLQQAQNAQIGKIGTAPASVGGMNTQNI